jgi:hypothetical protein
MTTLINITLRHYLIRGYKIFLGTKVQQAVLWNQQYTCNIEVFDQPEALKPDHPAKALMQTLPIT